MKKPLSKATLAWFKSQGQLGGKARAAKLTKAQRLASSRKANAAKKQKRKR